MKKYLNSPRYTELLQIVGRSRKPLSIYAMMKELNDDTYVYEMVKNLCPSHFRSQIARKLCTLEELVKIHEKPDLKNRLFKQLDTDLHLGYYKTGKEVESTDHDQDHDDKDNSRLKIGWKKIRSGLVFTMCYDSGPISLIEFKIKNEKLIGISPLRVVIEGADEGQQGERQYSTALREHKTGEYVIYYYIPKKASAGLAKVDYLEAVTINENENGLSKSEYFSEDLEYDYKNLLYKINFKGLVLSLFNVSTFPSRKKNIRDSIHEVISNPIVLEMAPFLKDWKEFEDAGFDVIGTLKEVAVELESYLGDEEDTGHITVGSIARLVRRATEIYFIRMDRFFFWKIDESSAFWHYYVLKKGYKSLEEVRIKANEYRLYILKLLKTWYKEDSDIIDKAIAVFER